MAHYDLAEIRKQCGITQRELADRLGLSINKIQYSESGQGSMSYSSLIKLGLGTEMTDYDEEPTVSWNGEALYAARKALRLTQKQFAELVGANFRDISRWEMGYNEPRAEMVERISAACGKKVSYFYASSVTPERISEILKKMTTMTERFSFLIETGQKQNGDYQFVQSMKKTYVA